MEDNECDYCGSKNTKILPDDEIVICFNCNHWEYY